MRRMFLIFFIILPIVNSIGKMTFLFACKSSSALKPVYLVHLRSMSKFKMTKSFEGGKEMVCFHR